MRLQILEQGKRKWKYRLLLWILKKIVGTRPGPLLVATYRPDMFTSEFASYSLHGTAGSREWSRGEAELFTAFVSRLNSCRF